MTLSLETLRFLATSAGAEQLTQLADQDLSDARALPVLTQLRKSYAPEQSAALLEMARLRQKAVSKFGADAARMFFTRDGLEQASDPLIRRYRASKLGQTKLLDMCCGIGSDALAFAAVGAGVVGVDHDPVRVEIARYNAAALQLPAQFVAADALTYAPENVEMIFFDPARRDEMGERIYHVERYQPPLSSIKRWSAPQIVVKLSPGVNLEQLADYHGVIEFVSVEGDLKEAVLWTGDVAQCAEGSALRTQATLLVGNAVHHWRRDGALVTAPIAAPRGWLVEPDPALLRAGLVQDAAAYFNGAMLDETIAYFTADKKPDSVWVRAWAIVDWMPFNLKKLRAYLREHHVGRVTVKKRGVPITPEALIPQLKLKGAEERTLVLTRYQGERVVLICLNMQSGGTE